MTTLTTPITASYNGHDFSVYAKTTPAQIRHVYDRAGRTVSHKIFAVTISDELQADDGADDLFQEVREKLEQPGGDFIYGDGGLGDFAFGAGNPDFDLVWGPKPRVTSWEPQGGGNAVKFSWTVEVATIDRSGATNAFALMEFNYTVTYNRDRSGWTSRTYTGYLRIPQTRRDIDSRTLDDNADNYVNRVIPPLIPGFRRETVSRTISDDKCTLDFSVFDTEMPTNIPPEFVVDVTASHRVQSFPKNLKAWTATLNARYEMQKGVTPLIAVEHFRNLLTDRLDAGRPALRRNVKGKNLGSCVYLPVSYSFDEPEIYGKPIAQFSYTYIFVTDQKNAMEVSQVWRPVKGSNWQKWSTSIHKTQDATGLAGLRFKNNYDAIIDLASGGEVALPKDVPDALPAAGAVAAGAAAGAVAGAAAGHAGIGAVLASFLNADRLTPENSWISYECALQIANTDEVVELKPLPPAPPQAKIEEIVNLAAKISPIGALVGNVIQSVIQTRAQPTTEAWLTGHAVRAGYEITPPVLLTVGGAPAVLNQPFDGRGIESRIIANWGVPICAATWRYRYLVTRPDHGQQGTPASIVMGKGDDKPLKGN